MKTATIDDGTLDLLARNPEAVAALPHLLADIAGFQAPEGCIPCQANSVKGKVYAAIRQAIALVNEVDVATLKGFLGVDQFIVFYTDAKTRTVNKIVR